AVVGVAQGRPGGAYADGVVVNLVPVSADLHAVEVGGDDVAGNQVVRTEQGDADEVAPSCGAGCVRAEVIRRNRVGCPRNLDAVAVREAVDDEAFDRAAAGRDVEPVSERRGNARPADFDQRGARVAGAALCGGVEHGRSGDPGQRGGRRDRLQPPGADREAD